MSANFAPYQDIPESSRALSPITSPRTSIDRTRRTLSSPPRPKTTSPARAYEQQDYFQGQIHDEDDNEDDNDHYNDRYGGTNTYHDDDHSTGIPYPPHPSSRRFGRPRSDMDVFTTSLGWRLDYEACLAYLLLPPAGGVLLLMLEHKSDYVRFHAWQSSLLFAFAFLVHIIFSWSRWVSWMLFVGDVCGILWLVRRAWVDAATLDRYEVPFFGPLASSILDDE
ncbi:hypothetical protein LEMA_P060860.1 [Plenodomus lingam JN3]|uniref:Uncharacterized protein n=1 Tax=Leptosphaeria maculans (strain JN3 / isolate v23.1.3 / race Av1-4-5-6-7-8) TaxID=985895 RepID=E4ZIN1_LEPMJ|nr:hypothetical protein LEMA_P060860.1 [Plenodomus lingam JN3]CBX91052.1 hypothetical protein LEMA_P060860.1 [Plenodomus lingam JN3]